MDTKKLRQKILDLAIHGKLVPQDPNDEPASVLLERIREEKDRLIKEGKIKKSKSTTSSDTSHYENVPFEVPEGWSWCTLEELSTSIGDGLHGTPKFNENGEYYFVNGNNLDGKISIKKETKRTTIDEYIKQGLKFNSQTIFVSINGTLGNVAFYNNEPIVLGKSACYINLVDGISKEYIATILRCQYFLNYCRDSATGSTIKNVPLAAMRALFIPIPSYQEQLRIVDEVENLLEYVDSLDENTQDMELAIVKAKSKILDLAIHGKLVPQDANEEPASELLKRIQKVDTSCDNPQYGKVPSSWVISTVGDVFTINPKTQVDDDTEAAFVPMTCVADGYSNTFEYECRKWGEIKKGFVHFQDDDVAVAKISPCLENRKSVVFHDLPNGIGAGTTELNVFRCKEILPEYALFYFKSQMFIGSCAGTYNGVVGQQRVAKSFIQELPIGIPPYKEQLRIVSKVNELFSQLDMIEKSLQA